MHNIVYDTYNAFEKIVFASFYLVIVVVTDEDKLVFRAKYFTSEDVH
jgi:hypothetical protein